MGIIKNRNQDKIANIFSHFAKMAIRNIKKYQIFKIYKIAKFSAQLFILWTKFYNKWFGSKNTIFGIINIYQAS